MYISLLIYSITAISTSPTLVPSILPNTMMPSTNYPSLSPSTMFVISTIAGDGVCTYNGDGIPATSASVYNPTGVTTDALGNVYIADEYNYRVRKISISTGIISTIAGSGASVYSGDGGAATSAAFYTPHHVALDVTGNLYITDSNSNRIRKVTISTGIISTIAGTGTAGYSGDNGDATAALLLYPTGSALDATGAFSNTVPFDIFLIALIVIGNVYIADFFNERIRKVTIPTGIITTVAGTGSAGYSGDNGPATSAAIWHPGGVALDSDDLYLYIADISNDRIRKVTISTGIITTIAGTDTSGYSGDNGPATSATLSSPNGVTVDSAGAC